MSKNNNNNNKDYLHEKWRFTINFSQPYHSHWSVSMFKAQSISPADRGAYSAHALKAGRSKCNISVVERPR